MCLNTAECPSCAFSGLLEQTRPTPHEGPDGLVSVDGLEFCVCPNCGTETVLPAQRVRNDARVAAAMGR